MARKRDDRPRKGGDVQSHVPSRNHATSEGRIQGLREQIRNGAYDTGGKIEAVIDAIIRGIA